jgi:hypothetical protein
VRKWVGHRSASLLYFSLISFSSAMIGGHPILWYLYIQYFFCGTPSWFCIVFNYFKRCDIVAVWFGGEKTTYHPNILSKTMKTQNYLKGRLKTDRLLDVDGKREGIYRRVSFTLKSGYLSHRDAQHS